MTNSNSKSLGDILLEAEMITKEQLSAALDRQKNTNEKLNKILLDAGYVTQMDIISALEFKLAIPFVDIEQYGVNQDACSMIPEALARRYDLIPLKRDRKILIVAMSDPLNVFAIDDIRIITSLEVQPVISTSEEIQRAISKNYGTQKAIKAVQEFIKDTSLGATNENINETQAEAINNAPIVKLVNSILEQAIRNNASDIHIEPFEAMVKVRYRVDGHLKEIMHLEQEIMQSLTTRIKIMANLNITEKRLPQDGRISIDIENNTYDLRVSLIPIVYGEKIVIRIIDKRAFLLKKEDLGFNEEDIVKFTKMLENPHGIILVTGPTGSGKSTTLYTGIQELNKPDVNIVTIEDPVESIIPGICQIQANPKIGLTFAAGLRSILRQDPDIIMLGEIRDAETAEIAIRSAITGHLVLSTLHTNDAASSVVRLVDMGVEPFLVTSSLVGVIAQRLVRKICPKCKTQYYPSEEEAELLGLNTGENFKISKGKGCPACLGTGYKGRIGVYEVMIITNKHREMINNGCSQDELKDYSIQNGMNTIRDSARKLVLAGVTTVEELRRVAFASE